MGSSNPKLRGKSGGKKSKDMTYTKVVGETLLEIGKIDKKVVVITAAMPGGTGITDFQKMPTIQIL